MTMGKTTFKPSEKLVSKVREFEGFRAKAYYCPAGFLTIGFGHRTTMRDKKEVTMAEATALLRDDLAKAGDGVNALGVCKTQGQYDALTDFVFNLGIGRLKRSTLLRLIKHSAPAKLIQAEFRKWVYAGGKVMPGLVTRRNWEAERFVE